MADIGAFCRVFLKGGQNIDLELRHYNPISVALVHWAQFGDDESFDLTDVDGSQVTFCASSVAWALTSTKETRQVAHDRSKMFDEEEEVRRETKTGFGPGRH